MIGNERDAIDLATVQWFEGDPATRVRPHDTVSLRHLARPGSRVRARAQRLLDEYAPDPAAPPPPTPPDGETETDYERGQRRAREMRQRGVFS